MVPGAVLIANRGEIAVRIARTVHALGARSATVFTAEDRDALHVDVCDAAVEVGSYLAADEIVAAAVRLGVAAVHPGYGFLSENPGFARAVRDAELTWVGPPVEAIELMGDKARAKQLAREAGVPVVPGVDGGDLTGEQIAAFAGGHGFPVVIKALAGGGGKGMRVVRSAAQLGDALAAARREAQAAFGDGRVLVERYLERPRHVEVQVLADRHGACVHLGERECSLQRRHQKIVEESPSPVVGAALRERMGAAAVALARACAYEGAGTVEFIVPGPAGVGPSVDEADPTPGFFFLEMNTRLQVEHPVTELVYGVDLVEQQLRVAAGEPLGLHQDALRPDGHAIEARLYAEDPANGFLPSIGTIRRYREPGGPGVRTDSGVREGTVVGTAFDPMLAKLVAHGRDREAAIRRLDRALAELTVLGVSTSAAFTRALLAREDVRGGAMDTGLVERMLAAGVDGAPGDLLPAAAIAAYVADTAGATVAPGPWRRAFEEHGVVRIHGEELTHGEHRMRFGVRAVEPGLLRIALDGVSRAYAVAATAEAVWVSRDGHHLEARTARAARAGAAAGSGSLEAPMPGTVLMVNVANGDLVEEGDVLVVVESMKMELAIVAPSAGRVEGLEVAPGDRVAQREILLAVTS